MFKACAQSGDLIIARHLRDVHQDKAFVKQSLEAAKLNSPYPLIHKGLKVTSLLLQGGSRIVIKTPYLREDHSGKPGKKRKKRGKKGAGIYPVLYALGIRDGVSPATRSEIALHTIQVGSYQEAIELLERRGLSCDVSTLVRIASVTAQADISLRDGAIRSAMEMPMPPDGPLAGKRVCVSIDGGRVRTRKRSRRKTKRGRHRFSTPWREPRVMVIDVLDEEGRPDIFRLPLYDVLIGDADAAFYLLVGYLRMLGAAHAEIVEFVADGADWIWDRMDRLIADAEIPESKLVEVVDFYHASEHLNEAVKLCPGLSKKKREKLYRKLLHILRHDPEGVHKIIKELGDLGAARRDKKMEKALIYFEKHSCRMDYAGLEKMKLPLGSGQVESAVRRVVNLRFKAPGSFWKENTVTGLMHLRAYFKAGRWDELIKQVLTGQFRIPSFGTTPKKDPVSYPNTETSCSYGMHADDYPYETEEVAI